jgi:hypothetical protein
MERVYSERIAIIMLQCVAPLILFSCFVFFHTFYVAKASSARRPLSLEINKFSWEKIRQRTTA